MRYDPLVHKRRSHRLAEFDYSTPGAYFVTICIHRRLCLLGEVEGEAVQLEPAGHMVANVWASLTSEFDFTEIDNFVVMPNHLHGLIWLMGEGEHGVPITEGAHGVRPYVEDVGGSQMPRGLTPGSLGLVVQRFKSITTARYARGVREMGWPPFLGRLWQRNYFEHVVRDVHDLERIRAYIAANPSKWNTDRENPSSTSP